MFSLKLVLCVCIFFVIGMEGAPKPQPKAEPKPQPKAEPKPYPPIGYPPYSSGHNLPDANPGPWNWNGFPPTRGNNRQAKNNGLLDYGDKFLSGCRGNGPPRPGIKWRPDAPDGTKGCVKLVYINDSETKSIWLWGECEKTFCVECKSWNHLDCKYKEGQPYNYYSIWKHPKQPWCNGDSCEK